MIWEGKKLSALRLPLSPPELSGLKKKQAGQKSWRGFLGLTGVRLDFSRQSAFSSRVWRQTRKIPFGEVRSYGWVARRIGNPAAARAVGLALRANPWPLLVPCHRVIRSDGSLGGFKSGLKWKKFLLDFEQELTAGPKKVNVRPPSPGIESG